MLKSSCCNELAGEISLELPWKFAKYSWAERKCWGCGNQVPCPSHCFSGEMTSFYRITEIYESVIFLTKEALRES